MADLNATPGWDAVPQLEITDAIIAGAGGRANAQAQALTNRMEYLGGDNGADKIGVTWFGGAKFKLSKIAESVGASLIGFIQAGTGAVAMAIQDALRERVTPKQFGAIADGVSHPLSQRFATLAAAQVYYPHATSLSDEIDWAAYQAAINYCGVSGRAKRLDDKGDNVYMLSQPLVIPSTLSGAVLKGGSSKGSYLKSTGGTFPLMKVAGSYARIQDFMFRPSGTGQGCMLVYAPECTITYNQFLSAANNQGSAILFADVNPDTGATVNGAYTHNVSRNVIGLAGYAFARGVEDGTTLGVQACKINENHIIADVCVKMTTGGGNTYRDNLLQSSTGGGIGSGIDLGAAIVAEKIGGNYFEGFAQGVLLRQSSNTYQAAHIVGNNFDNCTQEVNSLGTYNYVFENSAGARYFKGWKWDHSSSTLLTINGLTGGNPIATFDDANKALKVDKVYTTYPNLTFSADGQTVTPTHSVMKITGGGAPRANCVLGTTGVQHGQELELIGVTWPVTLLNTTIKFNGSTASNNFGNTAGYVQCMRLRFDSALGKWVQTTPAVIY